MKAFEQKLQLLLGVDTSLHIRDLTQELHTGRTILLFYVEKNDVSTIALEYIDCYVVIYNGMSVAFPAHSNLFNYNREFL